MNWNDLLTALALVMVIEGLFPFVNPQGYKNTMQQIMTLSPNNLRSFGLVLMLVGVVSLFLLR